MDLRLKNKVIIVTGGSKGIGEGITRAIAEEDGIPIIATKSEEATLSLIKEFADRGKKAGHLIGDLQDVDFCKKVVEYAIKEYGSIYGVVNNAGVNDGAGLEAGPQAFKNSVELNLFHYYNLVHYALPHLKETKGSIINISSKVALTGQ
ncbi:MAG TPA: SDR family NAD(P)-dependent oxidoreductase, partial [Anditalea sp.]|nr:SDR family NAD(P)-dependent oxidoreductase [Anditalea sp.]